MLFLTTVTLSVEHHTVFVSQFRLAVRDQAGKQNGLGSIPLWLSLLFTKVIVCGQCLVTLSLTINETLKWLSSLPTLMQKSFWWWECSNRYIISLSLLIPNKPDGFCGRKAPCLPYTVSSKHHAQYQFHKLTSEHQTQPGSYVLTSKRTPHTTRILWPHTVRVPWTDLRFCEFGLGQHVVELLDGRLHNALKGEGKLQLLQAFYVPWLGALLARPVPLGVLFHLQQTRTTVSHLALKPISLATNTSVDGADVCEPLCPLLGGCLASPGRCRKVAGMLMTRCSFKEQNCRPLSTCWEGGGGGVKDRKTDCWPQLKSVWSDRHANLYTLRTLWGSLSSTVLQTLPDLVTPLKGHSLSPRSCPPTRSAPSERFGYWYDCRSSLAPKHAHKLSDASMPG